MRTTLSIDDEVYSQVKEYAEGRSMTAGEAVTQLLRRALTTKIPMKRVNGFFVFDLPEDSPVITTEMVRALEDEL